MLNLYYRLTAFEAKGILFSQFRRLNEVEPVDSEGIKRGGTNNEFIRLDVHVISLPVAVPMTSFNLTTKSTYFTLIYTRHRLNFN